jgi:hypothetical protein
MMVGTMAEGATSACVRVTPRFPMAACRRGPPDPHPLARTEQPGLIGTSQPSFDPPGPPRDLPPVIPFPNSTISGRCGL